LTEYSNLSEAEVEETEIAVVMVKTAKTAEATEMAVAVMTTAVVTVKTATTAEATEMAAAVMTMAEKVAVVRGSVAQYLI
jgi:hypothetical protein